MSRPKSNGPYAPLSATYYRDDAILEAGQDAELLFVRCLAFLADAASDGFITDRQMEVVVGMGMRKVPARVAALVEVGVLERVGGGYLMRSWLKWNKSTEEIGKHLKRDRERKASGTKPDSTVIPDGIDAESERNDDGFQTDSADQITTSQVTTSQSKSIVAENRADVESLCTLLAALVEENGSKRPKITKAWLDSARLLIDKDGRDTEAAARLIRWSQGDPFWRGVVLSMPKFRDKYDQLRLAANRQIEERKQSRVADNLDVVRRFAAMEQQEQKAVGA